MYFDEINNNFSKFEEENNYLNLIKNKYYDYNIKDDIENYNITFDNININNYRNKETNLNSLTAGFNKGNMFKELYKPYKNYNYKVVVENKKDYLLLQIQELTFAVKDLNLYLDINPNDTNIIKIFNEFNIMLKQKIENYEKDYGQLTQNGKEYTNSFCWVNNPWPWENKGDDK